MNAISLSSYPLLEIYGTQNKRFEYAPHPEGFDINRGRLPETINVFSLPSERYIKSYRTLAEFIVENPEMLPENSLEGYCEMSNAFFRGMGFLVVSDAERFKQKHTNLCNTHDVSSVHNPYLGKGEVTYFVALGLQYPMRVTITKPYYGPEAKVSYVGLPLVSVPVDKQPV
jgi:hypothetical protein